MNFQLKSMLKFLIYMHILGTLDCARLLGIFPMPGRSHYLLAEKMMKGLAVAGYDVTFITPYKTKDVPQNVSFTDIVIEGVADTYNKKLAEIDLYVDSNRNSYQKMVSYTELFIDWINKTLHHPKVRALMQPGNKFDAVLMEQFFDDALKYFAHHFKCPLILTTSAGPLWFTSTMVGQPSPPSYVPHVYFNGQVLEGMSFFQRMSNLYSYIVHYAFDYWHLIPLQDKVLHEAFPDAPYVTDLNNYTAIVLSSSHLSILDPMPLVPNLVEVGGYHIDAPKKLPQDMQQFLDNATEGVIYFSMGTNIKSKDMPEEKKLALLNAFSRLKQKVLWKFEEENMIKIPKNMLIKNWMPQRDILAHPNVKLFITHGGFLSTTETIFHGKPVLVIPVFADQFLNADRAVQKGYGLKLPYDDPNFNEETIFKLLKELLDNPKYMDNAQLRSRIFHDRPLKPMEAVVYWVNYTLRYHGAKHLMVAGANQPFYQYLMLDVVAFHVAVAWLGLYLLKLTITKLGDTRKTKIKIH
uniref:UDP-glucuronosyltransferase n=1 Tax=Lissorhoptrus oryzophilus TaxID=308863 RepID=A0A2R4FXE4_9CUCU|nr:UDP-glucuronosyltransferase 40D9 [Lissorhoptrus oryzophilus]